jgi:rubrerythrin
MGSYVYNMKERINISIDTEVANAMRVEAIKKYGSLRAFSQLIEDTYTHKNQVSEDPGLTPEEIAVLDRADNEPPEGSPACDPWADIWICRKCWGGLFESFSFIHAPMFCPLCGQKNTLVRYSMVPDAFERAGIAARRLQSTPR